ncbi:TonB-dependent receptor [Thalassotalea crassostreae]|uniref:TonB-dependent receptor n=1 Tax=Thalassotalea crassostreae TaxID=1763536 RepID=UPI000837BA79|nr:TonB-dependent receptor [Thalassotalea crassostreae]
MIFNKKNKISNLFCLSLLSVSINSALAQEADNVEPESKDDIEVIEVNGYLSSVKKSILSKKAADSILDSIEAEDLGKFPDTNVAESLQRITGVSIDRNGGEGSKVSVRGLGPEFNVVTFNNRVMPNPDGSRSFSFDILASEMVSRVDVYKTSKAELSDGGIGAVIDVRSLRPLDLDEGFTGSASVKAMHDELSEETDPQFSGVISFKDDGGDFGISASIASHKRTTRSDYMGTSGWWPMEYDLDANGAKELVAWAPQGISYGVEQAERERTSGMVVAQYALSDDLVFTLDGLYSEYDTQADYNQIAHWWGGINNNNAGPGSVKVDEQGTLVYWAGHAAPTEMVHSTGNRPTETYMVGFNVEKLFADDSVLTFDMSYAKSQNTAGGTQSFAVSGFRNTTESSSLFQLVPGNTIPSLTFPVLDEETGLYTGEYQSNPAALTDPTLLANHFMVVEGDDNEDTIKDLKLDWTKSLDFGVISSVKVGAFYHEREFQRTRLRSADEVNNGTSTGFGDDIPDNIGILVNPSDFLSGANGSFPTAWLETDNDALRAYYESDDFIKNGEYYNQRVDDNGDPIPNLDYTPQVELANSPGVKEENIGLYVQLGLEGEIASMPWSGNIGVRVVETEQTSTGWGEEIISITPNPDDPTVSILETTEAKPLEVVNEYEEVLPSMNLKLEVREDVDVRLSLSKTITRPELNKIGVDVGYNTRPTQGGFFGASGGNPYLEPYTATNFDIAANWYVNESSYLGITYMHKDIEDFIVTAEKETVISGYDFLETRPFNLDDASISSVEVATNIVFDFLPGAFSGLGVQMNYTFVDDDDAFVETDSYSFGIDGLSDTGNFILFYEYQAVQVRASYNWREKYLWGFEYEEYTTDYGQWDASASYDINDNFTIFAEGVNLTEESVSNYQGSENRIIDYTYYGRRFSLGVRASF